MYERPKEWVAMEAHCCIVCCKIYDTGVLLLQKQLRKTLPQPSVTGYGLCPEHQAVVDSGQIILVETDPFDCAVRGEPHTARRTGRVVYIKKDVWSKIFNVPAPPNGVGLTGLDTFPKLESIMTNAQEATCL